MSKDEIIKGLTLAATTLADHCRSISEELFFYQPAEKWSIAQNVKHLVISANATRLAYRLPKFVVRLYAGKPNRPSRSYDELVEKYKAKLAGGGKASGRFIPLEVSITSGRDKLLDQFTSSMTALQCAINKNWTDDQLDRFIAPHPLLGKITLRELAYFTIYHTYHHLHIIKSREAVR